MRYAALLRGINVGGNKTVSMAALRDLAAALGLDNPRTLLQSGNLVFSSRKSAGSLESLLEAATQEQFSLVTRYFVRASTEWQATVDANPFPDNARRDPSHLVVVFLRDGPSSTAASRLQSSIVGRETSRVIGRQAYIVYPDGIGESKLTLPVIEKALGTTGTARNWNTVMKIATVLTN